MTHKAGRRAPDASDRRAREAVDRPVSRAARESTSRPARKRASNRMLWTAAIAVLVGFVAISFSTNLVGGVKVGDALPAVALAGLDGSTLTVDEWRGRPLVLRFSSATCAYCSRDFELLDRLQQELGEAGRVVAVQVADTPASVRSALMGAAPATPVVMDPSAELAQALGIRSLPAVAFVTARGTLSSLASGEITQVDVAGHLRLAMLGGPTFREDLEKAARRLRCQECEGRSVWESDARTSIEIRQEIERRLLAGERPDEIVEGFRAVYGDWILMAPPAEGIAALAWYLPLGGLAFGAAAWLIFLKRRARPEGGAEESEAPPAEQGEALAARVKEYM